MSNGDAANHWRAIEEEKLRKRVKELDKELDRMHRLHNATAKCRDMYMNAATNYRDENAKLREALKAIESGDLYHPEKSARRALLGGGEK